jgi:hypothetical protein
MPVGSPAGAVTLLSLTGVRMDQLTEQPVQAWSSFRGGSGSPLRTWVRNRLSPESF